MKTLIIVFLLFTIPASASALDIVTAKKIQPHKLAQEIEDLTGLKILGKDQNATMSTNRLRDGRMRVAIVKKIGSLTSTQRAAIINHINKTHTGEPTTLEKRQSDPAFPSIRKMATARLECDLGDCTMLEAVKAKYQQLKTKYP